ncbi:unnamed protein product [Vitrella brassicaformis CCMP3155]|uniref:Uncharacterized protein n=1 Tax=Vitrella brassicaformis (strain CCMP3155) TaxID=1169540 RepID=A0A0G4EFY6_VITBC|nr:unnamed protein product [Vitrella brassicaformis CCMP3155]|eukprot:CEL94295.1 unnamed protein product [Vitrella brassicaformis CCMP3155]
MRESVFPVLLLIISPALLRAGSPHAALTRSLQDDTRRPKVKQAAATKQQASKQQPPLNDTATAEHNGALGRRNCKECGRPCSTDDECCVKICHFDEDSEADETGDESKDMGKCAACVEADGKCTDGANCCSGFCNKGGDESGDRGEVLDEDEGVCEDRPDIITCKDPPPLLAAFAEVGFVPSSDLITSMQTNSGSDDGVDELIGARRIRVPITIVVKRNDGVKSRPTTCPIKIQCFKQDPELECFNEFVPPALFATGGGPNKIRLLTSEVESLFRATYRGLRSEDEDDVNALRELTTVNFEVKSIVADPGIKVKRTGNVIRAKQCSEDVDSGTVGTAKVKATVTVEDEFDGTERTSTKECPVRVVCDEPDFCCG